MPAKYQQLASILRSELRQVYRLGNSRLATEAELAQRYHMSRQTVRHALQLLEEEGLIERRQGSGTFIIDPSMAQDPHLIVIITTFMDDYIFPTILHDAQTLFSRAGYATMVYATQNQISREREILTALLEQKVSAILAEGSKTVLPTSNSDLYLQLQARGIPILFLHGSYSNLPGFPCLLDDNYSGGYLLAQYLIRRGHSLIAGIFKSDDMQGPQRYHGMINALRDHQASIRDSLYFWYDTADREAMLHGGSTEWLDHFIQSRLGQASAVICYNDEIAHFLIRRLIDNGKSVPEDIAVVSFDNSYYCQLGPVPITSLGHKSQRPGRVAASMLLDILAGKQPEQRSLAWELICRNSG